MIEALLRLIPRWVLPAGLAVFLWWAFIYMYVADTFYFRMTLPQAKETTKQAMVYSKYHGLAMTEDQAMKHVRCVFDHVYEDSDLRFGFSLYVATATLIGSEALKRFPAAFDDALRTKACGDAPWIPS